MKTHISRLTAIVLAAVALSAAITLPAALGSKRHQITASSTMMAKVKHLRAAEEHVGHSLALAKLRQKFNVFRHGDLLRGGNLHAITAAASLTSKLQSSLAATPEFNPSTSVSMRVDSMPVVVIAGGGRIAIYNGSSEGPPVMNGTSAPRATVEREGLWGIGETAAGQVNDIGLVPNGNTTVKVSETNGASETVPVTNNVVKLTGSRTGVAPNAVTYENDEQKEITTQLPVPGPAPGPTAPSE